MGLTLAMILLSYQPCLWLRYTSQPQTTVLHWFGEVAVTRVMASNTNSRVDSDLDGYSLWTKVSVSVAVILKEKSEYAVVLTYTMQSTGRSSETQGKRDLSSVSGFVQRMLYNLTY